MKEISTHRLQIKNENIPAVCARCTAIAVEKTKGSFAHLRFL